MRIAMISTYPPIECGIATYSENLCGALKGENNEILVVSQHGASGTRVYPVYNAADDNIAGEIYTILAKLTPDLVHIQHEFGLYGGQHGIQINELILRLRMAEVPVAVTFHTVRSPMPRDDEIILGNIVRDSDLIIVHEKHQKEILEEKFGHGDRIRVIPHGIRDIRPVPGAREMLGLAGKKVALLAGYFRPTKRFERIIGLWPRVAERNPDAVLLMAGKMRGIEFSDYHDSLMEMVKESPAADRILCLRGQFPQYTFDTIISAADCMVLPYEAGAQSGILANAAAFHVPVVTSDLKSFAQWNETSGGGLTSASDDEFVDNLSRVLGDDGLNRKLRNSLREFIKPYLWDAVGHQHQGAYEGILKTPYEDSRYFYVPEPEGE